MPVEMKTIDIFRNKANVIAAMDDKKTIRDTVEKAIQAGEGRQLLEALQWKQDEIKERIRQSQNVLDMVKAGHVDRESVEKYGKGASNSLSVAEGEKKSVDFAVNLLQIKKMKLE
jgi:hypothetical protein